MVLIKKVKFQVVFLCDISDSNYRTTTKNKYLIVIIIKFGTSLPPLKRDGK